MTDIPTIVPEPLNPFRVVLVAVWVVGLTVGLITFFVGIANYSNFSAGPYTHDDSGLVEIAIGAVLLNLGVVAAFVQVGAELVLWRPKPVPASDPAE